ncbi:hypothetical protein C0580_01580 [Candidatus Parcubacteria bacterium]|nr:MAG: hypothetical protein C0580_01580 [Candidatus Parcubacteria bacterium]
MRSNLHFHFYSRILVLAVFVLTAWAWYQAVETKADIPAANPPRDNIEIGGWAWSELTGWVSLNCKNDVDGDGVMDDACSGLAGDWGLYVENDYIKGCGYSGTILTGSTPLGWICWSDPGGTLAPAGGVSLYDGDPVLTEPRNQLDETSYASILSFEGIASGSSELRFPIDDYVNPATITTSTQGCFNCYRDPWYTCDVGFGGCDCAPDAEGNMPDSCADVLNCPDVGDPPVPDSCILTGYHDKCDNCLDYDYFSGVCSDDPARFCTTNDDCVSGEYCRNMSTCSENIDINCTDGIYTCSGSCVEREIGGLKSVLSGIECSSCSFENVENLNVQNNSCALNAYEYNINSCESCDAYYQTTGVIFDNRHNTILAESDPDNDCDPLEMDPSEPDFCIRGDLCGWAWNSWDSGSAGLGWFQFSPRISTTTKPYFSVEKGKIYSQKDIFNRYSPPFGHYNASYLIEAGGTITNLVSSSTLSGYYQGELGGRPIIEFPSQTGTKYANALGVIDTLGVTTTAYTIGVSDYNKYGSKISTVTDAANFASEFTGVPNGKVVYVPESTLAATGGNLTLNDNIVIKKGDVGTTNPERGSVIIVVEGNMIINGNITYETGGTAIENLKQIPSAVWIVLGTVFVMPTVDDLSGSFVVLGSPNTADCSGATPPFNCGAFLSGSYYNGTDTQLEVKGSVLARRFYLVRDYVSDREPAEKFVNDGRLQANPPLGMEDFSKVIPRFSESPF